MSPIRSVLIVKLGAIGDVVMASPMAAALGRAHPGVRVTWLAGRGVVSLLERIPGIDEVVAIDDRALLAGSSVQRAGALASAARTLRKRRFDLVLNGHPDPRYRVLEGLVRAGETRRFSRSPRRRALPVPGRYHGDEYLRLALGEDGPSMASAALAIHDLPDPPSALEPGRGSIVGIAPGGARNVLSDDEVRRWPVESYAEMARQLGQDGVRIALTGAPDDEWVREAFADTEGIIDLVGHTTLLELVAALAACDVVVTHDSGPLHLARLAGTPTVALFGPTHPREKVPPGPSDRVMWSGADLPCCPCYDGRTYAHCPERTCMRAIAVDPVVATVRQLLDHAGEKS